MKLKLGLAGQALACAACCAPLLVPLLAGTGAVLGIEAVSLDAAMCIGIPAIALVGGGVWLALHKRQRASCECRHSCDPASRCG